MKITRKQAIIKVTTGNTFKAGMTITRENFVKIARTINPELFVARNSEAAKMRSYIELVKMQSQLNNELSKKGLYIKSKNYQQEFVVLGKEDAAKEIARYHNQAHGSITRASTLVKSTKKGK